MKCPTLVVLVYQISSLETLRLEIPVRGTLRKIPRDLNTLLPSNTIRTEIRIYVAGHLISSHPEKIAFGVRDIDQMTSKCSFQLSLLRRGREIIVRTPRSPARVSQLVEHYPVHQRGLWVQS